MLTRHLSEAEVIELCKREESHFFDAKAKEVAGKKIQRLVVAFANADGGEIAIGIKDKKDEPDPEKRWHGFLDLEQMNGMLQEIFNLAPQPAIKYQVLASNEHPGYVLYITVDKSSEVHKTAANEVFQRHGSQCLPLSTPEKIAALGFAKGANSFEDQLLNGIPPDVIVDAIELKSFIASYSPKSDPLDFAINQNLLDYKSWEPRVAAAVLFHASPSTIVPRKCAVKITRYETREDDPERDHLADQVTVEGPLYRLIIQTVQEIKVLMNKVEVWTVSGLQKLDYPDEAIWETLVNAIIHRDYSISDDVQVLIFDNRIEILSPGKLPGYVTIENILDARFSRNSKIVRTLARYPDPPNKDLGEGLNTTFQKMKEWGLKAPAIEESGNYVKVTLPHTPLAAPATAIMEFLANNGQITNKQARELTGIKSENLVKVEFYKIRDEGLIERVPGLNGPKSAWQLTKNGQTKQVIRKD